MSHPVMIHPAVSRPTTTARPTPVALALVAAVAMASAAASAGPLAAQTVHFGQTPAEAVAARAAFERAFGVSVQGTIAGDGQPVTFGPLGSATLANALLRTNFISSDDTARPLTFTFTQGLNAFAGTFTDIGTCCANQPFPQATLRLTFYNGAAVVGTVTRQFGTTPDLLGDPAFIGVTGLAAFTRVEVLGNAGDAYNIGAPIAGVAPAQGPVTTVPEPSTWALVGAGLVATVAARRRRGAACG